MPTFVVNMKHTPESCPMFNDAVKKKFKEPVTKRVEAAKKHDIRILSAYTSILDHTVFFVVDAPSQPAVENYFLDIGFAFWNDIKIRQARPVEDVIKRALSLFHKNLYAGMYTRFPEIIHPDLQKEAHFFENWSL